jgi:hypothetical protein
MAWSNLTWVDDDGSLGVGTAYTAARMNNIELGIKEGLEDAAAADSHADAAQEVAEAALAAAAAEKSAREAAVKGEKEAREAGDAAEKKAREEADATEKSAREAADTAAIAASQPVDSDLTAIAALTTTSFGRSFLALANAAAGRTLLELGSAATQSSAAFDAAGAATAAQSASQPLDSDLTAIAALTTTSFGRELLTLANAEAVRSKIGAAAATALTAEEAAREAADLARPPALAHDASSMSAIGTNTLSWNHEPVTARPRAILVLISQSFTVSVTDQVTSVAYGEQTMTRIGSSFVSGKGAIYAYLLTGKIKPGKQQVVVNTNLTGTNKRAMAVSVAGPPLAPVKAKVVTANGTGTGPSITNGTVWDERVVYSLLSGVKNPAPGATQTEIAEQEFSAASFAQWDVNKANTEPGKTEQSLYGTQTLGDYIGIQVGLGLVKDWGLVTELPPSAACAPGDTCQFIADNTNGVIWDLLYDGEGEFPWKKIGGPPLRKVDGSGRTTASPSYQTTGSPTLTVPLKGVYDFEFGSAYVTNNTAGDSGYVRNGFFLNGAIVSDIAARMFANGATPLGRTERGTFSVAGQTVDNRYISEGSVNVTFFILRISLDPVRVG